jgi:hypothetical protein
MLAGLRLGKRNHSGEKLTTYSWEGGGFNTQRQERGKGSKESTRALLP